MKTNKQNNLLILFEGIDNVGKTTMINTLKTSNLTANNIEKISVKENAKTKYDENYIKTLKDNSLFDRSIISDYVYSQLTYRKNGTTFSDLLSRLFIIAESKTIWVFYVDNKGIKNVKHSDDGIEYRTPMARVVYKKTLKKLKKLMGDKITIFYVKNNFKVNREK